ncbi:MAG TPA: hypothetical protein VEU62_14095 [Bryobacterales bacterium]|nr:hypothetical protein [Bryobacterales bacterium]
MRRWAMTDLRNLTNTTRAILLRLGWKYEMLLAKCNEGQDLVEYALMAGFVALSAAATLDPIGDSVEKVFEHVRSVLIRARNA